MEFCDSRQGPYISFGSGSRICSEEPNLLFLSYSLRNSLPDPIDLALLHDAALSLSLPLMPGNPCGFPSPSVCLVLLSGCPLGLEAPLSTPTKSSCEANLSM